MPFRRSAVRLALFATLATLTLPPSLRAAPGDLDLTFDGDGIVTTTPPGSTINEVRGVAVQPGDGHIVAVGFATIAGVRQFMIARYDTTGALDATFGGGDGIVLTPIGAYSEADAVVIQPGDGMIVVAGCANSCVDIAVARYDSTGVLDPTFDGDGIVTTSIGGAALAHGVALQSDGAIVVAGRASVGTVDFAVVRYTSAGVPDATFGGGDGIVTTNIPGGFGNQEDVARGVVVQSDGKIVAAGWSHTGFSFARYAVVRYEDDGDLDPTFSGDGIVAANTSGNPDIFDDVQLQSDGMIVTAGKISNLPTVDIGVGRIDPADGSFDATFSGDGIASTDVGATHSTGYALAVQSDGRIVAVGQSGSFPPTTNLALARFESNGTVDATFGTGGTVITTMPGHIARAVALQSDGAIVVGTGSEGSSGSFSVLRYQGGSAGSTPTPTPTETPTPTVTATPTATLTPPCPPLPIAGCRTPALPAKAFVSTLDKSDDTKDTLQWKWLKGAVTTKDDFGTPLTTTSYQLCIYDGASNVIGDATIPAGGICGTANPQPCWKDKSNGFDYKDKDRTPDGIEQLTLRQGLVAGKASIQVKGKGVLLDDPAYPFAPPITVQLTNGTAVCWEAVYSAPSLNNTVGPPGKFKDKAD